MKPIWILPSPAGCRGSYCRKRGAGGHTALELGWPLSWQQGERQASRVLSELFFFEREQRLDWGVILLLSELAGDFWDIFGQKPWTKVKLFCCLNLSLLLKILQLFTFFPPHWHPPPHTCPSQTFTSLLSVSEFLNWTNIEMQHYFNSQSCWN